MGVATILALVLGWMMRDEGHLTPEHGLGYWLGIAGASAMLALLIYPLRKRLPSLKWMGSTVSWFRIHMFLGIAGPLLILYHCNFSLGAPNSNVALFTMLIVAGSGVVGRYLYGKVHVGLDGRKAAVSQLLADADILRRETAGGAKGNELLLGKLEILQRQFTATPAGLLPAIVACIRLRARIRHCRSDIMREASAIISANGRNARAGWWARRSALVAVRKHLDLYFAALRKAAAFALFERLFALWHVLHLPLFVLLVLTVIAHVLAVHRY
jgi:hypothetical protein